MLSAWKVLSLTQLLHDALSHLSESKAPGCDDLTIEFYLAFCDDLLQMINAAWQNNHLPLAQKHGIVQLVPKKPLCDHFSDWRPITLIPIFYKLIDKMVSHKLYMMDCILINMNSCQEDKSIIIFTMHSQQLSMPSIWSKMCL